MKFGDRKTILNIVKSQLPSIITDFPIEVFRNKYEILLEITALTHKADEEIAYFAIKN